MARGQALAPYIVSEQSTKRYDVLRKVLDGGRPVYRPYASAGTKPAAERIAALLTDNDTGGI